MEINEIPRIYSKLLESKNDKFVVPFMRGKFSSKIGIPNHSLFNITSQDIQCVFSCCALLKHDSPVRG